MGQHVVLYSGTVAEHAYRAELARLLGFWRWVQGSGADRWRGGIVGLRAWREHVTLNSTALRLVSMAV